MSTAPASLRMVEVSGAEALWLPPASAAAVPLRATSHVDEVREATGTGRRVSVAGPVEVITDLDVAAHHLRTLADWSHGPHDTLLRLRPQMVSGLRPTRAGA
ncbi:pyridoxamine 5'-phosphate oxidase family protein [Streptomyces sp. NPDC005538]|uniref:pyridoxamine 5'-phosphate oxidase family protein n=1 Tax=unclassified Streptomyces TaxID=2593676 RepID=UPI0033B2C0D7